MLKSGWAKLKELKRDATEEDSKKKEAENEAKTAGKGLWNPHGQQVRVSVRGHVIYINASTRLVRSTT